MPRVRLLLLVVVFFSSFHVWAEKPDKAKGGKHSTQPYKEKHQKKYKGGDRYDSYEGDSSKRYQYPSTQTRYFNEQHRVIVRDYYTSEFNSGHCPPGLAKKHNGCLPPGQARRWQVGQVLPRNVIYYDLPDHLLRQIGLPPVGYRFVRVDTDILLLAVGTGLVVDALTNMNALP